MCYYQQFTFVQGVAKGTQLFSKILILLGLHYFHWKQILTVRHQDVTGFALDIL